MTESVWWKGRKLAVTNEAVDDIMATALEGDTASWCDRVWPAGAYLGSRASEQISRGGVLYLHSEEGETYTLNREKFLRGLRKFFRAYAEGLGCDFDCFGRDGAELDPCELDACAADWIVQIALFGEPVYG